MPRKAPEAPRKRTGSIIPKGDGKWMIRWYVGTDGTGKRIYNAETITGTYTQADRALAKKTVAKAAGTLVATTKITLCEFLTGHKTLADLDAALKALKVSNGNPVDAYKGWLGGRVDLSPKTARDYCARIRSDVLPTLGSRRLDGLTRAVLQELVQHLSTERELSSRTIDYTMTVLGGALRQAVRDGILAKNPAEDLVIPKGEHAEIEVLDVGQIAKLLESTANVQRKALWAVLLTAGLRPQEALALTWDDIDFDAFTITVRRALIEVRAGKWEVGQPKTKGSTRTVVIPKETMEILKPHRVEQARHIMQAGSEYNRGGVVFAGRTGEHLDLSAVRRRWKGDLKSAGLPERRLYASRHSHFTALLAAGVHIKVAQDRGGWASTNMLLNNYSHVLPSMQKEASDLVGSLIFSPKMAAVAHD